MTKKFITKKCALHELAQNQGSLIDYM